MRKIIFFELNEVPFQIIDFFCKRHPNTELARILPASYQYETVNRDEGHLSPWITWPTLHRGVTNKLHQIKDFGENLTEVDKKYPPIWKLLQSKGISTGVFASMHSYPLPGNYQDYSFYVPDPFAGESTTHPANIIPFQKFNLAMSRKSGRNVDGGIDIKAAAAMALSLPAIGIKPATLADVAGQLVAERKAPWVKTRRRTYQSVLAFDIYLNLLKKKQPQFSTYFSNHVASAMHRYWAATFPDQYQENTLTKDWQETYKGEIEWAMQKFDAFLKQLVKFVDGHPEYVLMFMSSMGQSATEAKQILTETYCHDIAPFIQFFGLQSKDWEKRAAMHPQYNFQVLSAEKSAELAGKLAKVTVAGEPLGFRQKEGFFSIDLGHKNMPDDFVVYQGEKVPLTSLGLTNEKIEDETGSTAYHIPEGSLVIYDPRDNTSIKERKSGIDACAIVPSILENFGLEVPSYMKQERIPVLAEPAVV